MVARATDAAVGNETVDQPIGRKLLQTVAEEEEAVGKPAAEGSSSSQLLKRKQLAGHLPERV